MADTERTVDLTPAWQGVLPLLLMARQDGETESTRKTADEELRHMAVVADEAIALEKDIEALSEEIPDLKQRLAVARAKRVKG